MSRSCFLKVGSKQIDLFDEEQEDAPEGLSLKTGELPPFSQFESWVGDRIRGRQVTVTLASSWCYFFRLEDFGGKSSDSTMLAYELESHLGVDAEDLVISAKPQPDGLSVVAADRSHIDWLVDSIEAVGGLAHACFAWPVLVVTQHGSRDTGWSILVHDDGGGLDVIQHSGNRLTEWVRTEVSAPRFDFLVSRQFDGQTLSIFGTSEAAMVAVAESLAQREVDFRPSLVEPTELLNSSKQIKGDRARSDRHDLLAAHGSSVHAGSHAGSLFVIAVSAILALAMWGVSATYRQYRIAQEVSRYQDEQNALYREVFPTSRTVATPLRRVRSEYQRLVAQSGGLAGLSRSSGSSSGASVLPRVDSADVMARFLGSLPTSIDVRVERLETRDGSVDAMFRIQDIASVAEITSRLSQAGFDVEPPETIRDDQSLVQLFIVADWNDEGVRP
ncbi:MAG: hypothetical protein AAF664_07180 [Planctomycetota bacterium]